MPFTGALIHFDKTSCTSCTILKADSSVVENVTNITESSDGGYTGKDADGNDVSFSKNENNISIATDKLTFDGIKQ